MKRFLQKSYSWLTALLFAVAFAVSSNVSAKSVEIAVGANQSITQGDISTYAAYWTGSQVNLYGDLDSEWGYLEVTSYAGPITKVEFYGASEMNTVTCLTGKVSGSSTFSVWEGSEKTVRFHSSSDIYVDKIVVYYEEGGAKECTVGVDHYADNVKPGKHEVPFSRYITIYMEELPATTSWTGSDNCPEGVTFTGDNGQQIRVAQFNHWVGSDSQVGIVLEEEVTTPGVYTLHIPEGLIPFVNGKWNKEINITWTLVEPDLRPTKDIVFDFTDGNYTNDGTLSYTKDGVVFTLNENRYNATAKGFRIGADGWVSFAAPEKATIKSIQLLQESSYGVNPDFSANVGEVRAYDKTLYWSGDDASVTLTDNYGTCYFTKAIVTLAVEESEEPVVPEVDPAEEAYAAWKTLVTTDMKAVKDEWGTAPEADVPGKKPAAVVKAVMEYYQNISWLFSSFSGFGDDWAAAKAYYANYGTTIEANYAEAQQIWAAYVNAELVPEVVVPTYTEPVLSAEDVSAEVAYYIFTDARGGLTVDGDQLKGTKEVGKDVDPTDVAQQFAFVNWEGNLYLYSLAAEKFIGKANRGNFTEEPVDPIYFKSADESTVMLYFDNSFNFNLGGSNQVTIDTWSKKDAGNSFKIMVAEKFDQTALLEKLANGGGEVEPTTKWEGEIVVNKTSISSVADLEGLQITFVDAQQVEFNEYGMYIVGNEDGSELYAVWAQYPEEGYNGTYTLEGNTVTLNNFSTVECDPIPAGTTVVYLSDFSAFLCNGEDVDGDVTYFEDYAIAYEGVPAPVPFELVFRNNNVVCENGKKVEANEAGVGADFYLVNEGLTAVGKTATLYKDGNAMSFVMTLVDGTAISFLGGSSLITEPGTYLLEVPEGTYVDAAGNPSIAFYGQWVVIQKDEPVVDPVKKDKYTIKLSGTDYYFTTTEVKDNDVTTYSISATPEYFYIEPSNGGYTIKSADTDKWVGYDVISSWDFSNDEKVWTINSLEGEPTTIYKNGTKGFGVDDRFEGAGVYTDKSGQYWVIEKFEEGGEVVDPVEPTDLSIFAGEWYFKGEGAYLNYYEENVTPKDEYVVNVAVENGKLYMTDLVGFVYDDPNAFIGTYDAQAETLTFNTPYADCYVVDDNYEYYTNFKPLVFNVVKDEEGNVSLVNTTGWDFQYEDWFYTTYNCGYASCVMTREKDEPIVEPEPTEWNGNIIFDEANSIDDLLTFTLEFEDAMEVESAGGDVLGVVFEENGNPYAIVLGNGVFDVFGGVNFDGSKATVEFVKIADLSADLQASAKAAAARIGGFTQTPGEASVVFAGKSFKVDGQLVTDILAKNYTFDSVEPSGIESINSYANDAIYDLSGRRVTTTNNGGLYIKNGRKVYMK